MSRGLLLLDVDGPLNPYAEKPQRRDRLPLEYKTLRITPQGWLGKPLRVWLAEAHGPMLLDFAERHDLELVWATTWEHQANTLIGPEIGLPELPVIEFGFSHDNIRAWKYPKVLEYAAGRPLVWFDDDFDNRAWWGAKEDFIAARDGEPTLLHHVDPRLGLTELDFSSAGEKVFRGLW